jgi:hypothetical protein
MLMNYFKYNEKNYKKFYKTKIKNGY